MEEKETLKERARDFVDEVREEREERREKREKKREKELKAPARDGDREEREREIIAVADQESLGDE